MGLKDDLERVREHLHEGESVLAAINGTHRHNLAGKDGEWRGGTLLATSERLAFYRKNMGGFDFEVYPYEAITSVDSGENMMGAHVRATVAGNLVEVKYVTDKAAAAELVRVVRAQLPSGRAPVPTLPDPTKDWPGGTPAGPLPSSGPGLVDELERLGRLRSEGLLTDEEFAAAKGRLLAG
jgi:hypothetical protein